MLYLVKKLLSHVSHYQAVLPYNLNWRLKSAGDFAKFLKANPLVVADIGARGGAAEELSGLKRYIQYHEFDADSTACESLGDDHTGRTRVFPYYVGDRNGPIEFHLYLRPGESSSLKPHPRYRELFGGERFAIDRSVTVESCTLDDVIIREHLVFPDMLKLDVQGGELAILAASPQAVKKAVLIEVEVEFLEIYKGQPLFHDVCEFMYRNGFELLYLNRAFANRFGFRGQSRGQITFGDALFGRREDRLEGFTAEAVAKYVILLINYGHIDFARHLVMLFPATRNLVPGVDRYFRRASRLTQGLIAQYDKVACLFLSLRGSNRLHCDSDRSWPFR
jgi:FkbM family methyltransferase